MNKFTSTMVTLTFTLIAASSMANETKTEGFTGLDHAKAVCSYGKRIDRKRDLNCVN